MGWKLVTMPFDGVAADKLEAAFEEVFTYSGHPHDAAMLVNRNPGLDGICKLYFSPGAARIFGSSLEAIGAFDCDPPQREEITLRVGHHGAEVELLPEGMRHQAAQTAAIALALIDRYNRHRALRINASKSLRPGCSGRGFFVRANKAESTFRCAS